MAKKLKVHEVRLPTGEKVAVDIFVDTGNGEFSSTVGEDKKKKLTDLVTVTSWVDEIVKKAKVTEIVCDPYIIVEQLGDPEVAINV